MRGYNSTIGDLENISRSATTGKLVTTNWPAITLTGQLTPNAFCFMQNLAIAGALSSPLIGSATIDSFGLIATEVINTQNNAAAKVIQGDNHWLVQDSDLECTGAAHGVVADLDTNPNLFRNRIKVNANGGIVCFGGILITNLLIGDGSSVAIDNTNRNVNPFIPYGNTIYNWGTALRQPNVAPGVYILMDQMNHITDCTKMIDDLYAATDAVPIVEAYNRTRDNTTPRTGVGDGFNIGEVATDTGGPETDYTNAGEDDFSLVSGAPGEGAGGGFGAPDIGSWTRLVAGGGGSGQLLKSGLMM